MTSQKRACCNGPPPRVTYVKIRGSRVGMVGLEQIFEQFHQAGRAEDEALERELVEQARIYNYIAPGAEEEYRWGLLKAYRAYVRNKEEGQPAWQKHIRRG